MAETLNPWRLDDFPRVLWEFDVASERFTAVHANASALMGYAREQWLEPGFWRRTLHPEDRDTTVHSCLVAIHEGRDHDLEYRMVAADGRVVWIRDFARVHRRDGQVFAQGVMFDVSARRVAEERQVEAERRLAAVVDSYDGVVALFDREGRVKEARGRRADPAIFGKLGEGARSMTELLGEEAAAHDAPLRRALAGETVEYGYPARGPDRQPQHFLIRMSPLLSVDGEISGAIAVVHDDTARVQREREHAYQSTLLRELAETSPDGILVTDREGRIRMHNARLRELLRLGDAELVGRTLEDQEVLFVGLRFPEEVRERAAKVLRDPRGTHAGEMDLADGRICEWYSAPVSTGAGGFEGRVLFLRDVTRRRVLEASLRRNEQLASIGMLAASVAHEVNNPLAYAATNVGFAVEEVERLLASPGLVQGRSLEDLAAALRDAQDGLSRVGAIVRELKSLSRADEGAAPVPTCPRDVIHSAIRLVRPQIVSRAQLVVSPGEVGKVLGNAQKLVQVLVNLLVNAAHAIPAGASDQRRIEVGTAPAGDGRVELFVRDDGAGISPEVMPRLFEPFFTTKPHGVGTGLGLAVCQRIIEGLGGELQVLSRQGHGTKVRVLLRAAPSA